MEKNKDLTLFRTMATELHVREIEGEQQSRTITGYAILFDTPSAALWSDNEEEAYEVISREAVTQELLDSSDIKMTMFHDRQLILARSNKGNGTLSYGIDDKGVFFEFEAPKTVDGDKALELVRRGDLAGCSFAFSTHYYDSQFVGRNVERRDGKTVITYTVNVMTGIYDFTLAADPAYPDTSVEAEQRELERELRTPQEDAEEIREREEKKKKISEQVREMRSFASPLIVNL